MVIKNSRDGKVNIKRNYEKREAVRELDLFNPKTMH